MMIRKRVILALSLAVVIAGVRAESKEKTKLYSFCSPSHYEMRDKWFLASVPEEFDVIVDDCVQISPTGEYMSPGFTAMMLKKVELIERAIQENWGKIFVYADVDIQFFAPFDEEVHRLIEGYDMLVQRNDPRNELCAGFVVIQANQAMADFWHNVKVRMLAHNLSFDDQTALNMLIAEGNHGVKWQYLPNTFFGGGLFTGDLWVPGKDLYVPKGVLIHHANYVLGVFNKMEQMKLVRGKVNARG